MKMKKEEMGFNEDRRLIAKFVWQGRGGKGKMQEHCQSQGENLPFLYPFKTTLDHHPLGTV